MVKAVFLDIDGTLLSFVTRRVPESAMQALFRARELGIKLFIATGRHKRELGISSVLSKFPFDGYVTQNGAYCYTGEKIVHALPMRKKTVEMFVDFIKQDPFTCIFCEEHDMFVNQMDARVIELLARFNLHIPPVSDIVRAQTSDIYQIVPFVTEDKEALFYSLPEAKVTKWFDGGYDIVNKNVNKWLGILEMLKYFQISPLDAAAIGDAENDVEMLREAGFSVAMGNALGNVKKCAKYVTTHVDDDGIKNAFEYLWKEGKL